MTRLSMCRCSKGRRCQFCVTEDARRLEAAFRRAEMEMRAGSLRRRQVGG